MGTRSGLLRPKLTYWDHPHAYGDKWSVDNGRKINLGSSPRVWGQVDININAQKTPRIIPTRMGTRSSVCPTALKLQDHPHAYGDKPCKDPAKSAIMGSSPRVWGQEFSQTQISLPVRIIPTRMGTSNSEQLRQHLHRDHPHAYGDKAQEKQELIKEAGSSPRVWGQDDYNTDAKKQTRIIPTRMGTRIPYIKTKHLVEDHPHAYGDKFKWHI